MSGSNVEDFAKRVVNGQMSRRSFLTRAALLGVSATSAGALLNACGGSSGSSGSGSKGGNKTIKLAVYSYIPANIDLQGLASAYESKNPGTKIEISTIPDTLASDLSSFVRKFTLEAKRGDATYDLIFGPTPWIEVAPLAEAGALEPFDKYLPKDVVSDMPGPVHQGNTYKGKIYGLPVWSDVVGFIYRKDLLKDAVGSDQAPQTWDDIVTMSQQVKPKLPAGDFTFGADYSDLHRLFLPIFVTMAEQPYTDKGLINYDDPGALKALKLMQSLFPYLPPNANQDQGSSKTFQAKKLAMELYWQAHYLRAVQAGVPATEIGVAGNPKGNNNSGVFWTTDVVLLKHSKVKEEAAKFWVEGFLKSPTFQQQSINKQGKFLPYTSLLKDDAYPAFMRPLAPTVSNGTPIPLTPAFEGVEYPTFQEQAQKMKVSGQSPEQTLANLKSAIADYKGQ
jgi:multiple sugar transport system substrate-binding protein